MANLQKIKELAEKKEISIRDLAERVGLRENQIHVMCRTNSTKIDTLERIAQVLGVHVSVFFDGTASPSHSIEGNNNQLNESGAYGNINGADAGLLQERIKSLEEKVKDRDALIAEKVERISELKERIEELKGR